MNIQIIEDRNSHKIGINEIVGLKAAMIKIMEPIQAAIKDKTYWTDVKLRESEYKSRNGFIPYSSNCGGIEISEIIPSCEQSNFDFLRFGECDECDGEKQCGYNGQECGYETEGYLDAKLRVWFKFEGINKDTNELEFYLYLGGGNGDAPYYRTKHEATVFEASFTCKSVAGLKRSAAKHTKKLMEILK